MSTLREKLYRLLRFENCAGEYTMYQAAQMALVAKQMDALLEECYQALQCPIKSQVMIELLKNNGYGATLGITVEE